MSAQSIRHRRRLRHGVGGDRPNFARERTYASSLRRTERARPYPNMNDIFDLHTIIPFVIGLVCGIPMGVALVIMLSITMLSSQRSRQEEAQAHHGEC